MKENIKQLEEIIKNSDNIVFFGGAGVSTESNISDFRSVDGLYNTQYKYPPETILSHSFFMRNTKEFYRFYKNKMLFPNAKPNAAHKFLARLEAEGKLKAIVTQNIDNLHQMAGSKNVLELHGSVYRNNCMKCGKFYDIDYVIDSDEIPKCNCNGIVKPDVVLYEEGLNNKILEDAVHYISNADVMIVGGTSLAVYPAAGLINYYKGNKLILVNYSSTPYDDKADLIIQGKIGEVFAQIEGALYG